MLKRLETVVYNGDAKLVERMLAGVLQVTEPTLPSHHFGTANVSG